MTTSLDVHHGGARESDCIGEFLLAEFVWSLSPKLRDPLADFLVDPLLESAGHKGSVRGSTGRSQET
jgi:hypothetical protein